MIGLVERRQFVVFGRDAVGGLAQLAVDRRDLLLHRTQFGAGQTVRRCRRLPLRDIPCCRGRCQLQILVDATGQMPQPAVEDGVLLVGDALQQVPVVRYHDERAGPGVQQILGRGQHVGVDIVGGFVEHQHIRFGKQREHQLQPAALAAGEFTDARRQVVAMEPEPLQQLRRGHIATFDLELGGQSPDDLADHVALDIGQDARLLVEHRQLHGLAALDPAAGGCDGPGDEAQQGRLARAVGADDAGAFTGCDAPLDIPQDFATVEGHRNIEQIDDILTQPGGRQFRELDRVAQRRYVLDQLVGGLDPEFRLRRPRRRPAPQPGQFLLHQVLAFGLHRRRLTVPLHPLQDVGRVSAVERFDDPVVHLPGRGGDLVEEPAVVCHHQQSTGITRPAFPQVLGQPGDAFDVEVVGRLVQDDDVPVAHQQRRQLHPAALPTRECADQTLPAQVGDQAGDDVTDLRITGPLMVGGITDERPSDGVGVVEGVGLIQDPDPQTGPAGHPAGVRGDPAGQQTQQARLAVAVAAHDADSVTVVDAQRQRVEHDLRWILQMQGLGPEQVCHPADLSGRRTGSRSSVARDRNLRTQSGRVP